MPILEFLSLLSTDTEWTHLAKNKQADKVLRLLEAVYGFVRGRSRHEEEAHRFRKKMKKEGQIKCTLNHEHTEECQKKAEEAQR